MNLSRKLLNLCESIIVKSSFGPFLLWYSDCPKYNRIISNREYFKSKGIDSELVFMSPQEYLDKVAKGFNVSYEKSMSMVDPKKVTKYIHMIQSGHKFPCPILSYNYSSNTFLQEGRHRAEAARRIGLKEIPVWVIKSNSDINNNIDRIKILNNEYSQMSKISNVWNQVSPY